MRHGEWELWKEDIFAPSSSSSPPAEADPLDELAKNNHCFISDLRLDPLLRREALRQLMEHGESDFSARQWQEADLRFKNSAEAKRCVERYLQNDR